MVEHRLRQTVPQSFVKGMVARALGSTLVSPLEVLRILRQVRAEEATEKTAIEVWRWLREEYGYTELFRGNLLNIARLLPHSVTMLFAYDCYRRTLLPANASAYYLASARNLMAAATCAMLSNLICFTTTSLWTCMVSYHLQSLPLTAAVMTQRDGMIALFRGVEAALLPVIPAVVAGGATRMLFLRLYRSPLSRDLESERESNEENTNDENGMDMDVDVEAEEQREGEERRVNEEREQEGNVAGEFPRIVAERVEELLDRGDYEEVEREELRERLLMMEQALDDLERAVRQGQLDNERNAQLDSDEEWVSDDEDWEDEWSDDDDDIVDAAVEQDDLEVWASLYYEEWAPFLLAGAHCFFTKLLNTLVVRAITFPFDTISKTVITHPIGYSLAVSSIVKEDGWAGFYRGFGMELLKIPLQVGVELAVQVALSRIFMYTNGYTASPFSTRPKNGVPQDISPYRLSSWLQWNSFNMQ